MWKKRSAGQKNAELIFEKFKNDLVAKTVDIKQVLYFQE